MTKENFAEKVKAEILNRLGDDREVLLQPVIKNNDTVITGLIILDKNINISPTIYLEPFYERYLKGKNFDEICDDILNAYERNLPKEDFDISLFKDFSKAKDNIIMKLVNKELNAEILKDVPYVEFQDLAIVFLVAVSDLMNEFATILIYNSHLNFWNVTKEQLYDLALKNTPILLKHRFNNMFNEPECEGMRLLPVEAFEMYILTNRTHIYGATCITYPGLLEQISELFDSDLILLPSSIHEVLIIPEKNEEHSLDYEEIRETIRIVNKTQLPAEEILSDHAYAFRNGELISI